MSDENKKQNETTRTLDLSTGKKGKKKVTAGMAAPVVQETINLSTPKEEKQKKTPAPEKPKQPPSGKKASKGKAPRTSAPATRRSGASLAELLDPETLAKLRGNEGN